MQRNDTAAPGHVCPGIRIHSIDIVQPPDIGISPIADMDALHTIVAAALAANSSAETPKKARWEARSEDMSREISPSAEEQLAGVGRNDRLRSALVVLVVVLVDAQPGERSALSWSRMRVNSFSLAKKRFPASTHSLFETASCVVMASLAPDRDIRCEMDSLVTSEPGVRAP